MAHKFLHYGLPGRDARRKKMRTLLAKRKTSRKNTRQMIRAEAQEADEVARDLKITRKDAAAQKIFDKEYKRVKNKPIFSKKPDPKARYAKTIGEQWSEWFGGDDTSPGTKDREKRAKTYSNKGTPMSSRKKKSVAGEVF